LWLSAAAPALLWLVVALSGAPAPPLLLLPLILLMLRLLALAAPLASHVPRKLPVLLPAAVLSGAGAAPAAKGKLPPPLLLLLSTPPLHAPKLPDWVTLLPARVHVLAPLLPLLLLPTFLQAAVSLRDAAASSGMAKP
jgi:hypothetical protein